MNPKQKVAAIESQMREILKHAKKITHGKNGAMTPEEEAEVELHLRDLENLRPQLEAAREAAAKADGVRSKTGPATDGWTKAATGLGKVAPGDKVVLPLADLLRRKDADVADQEALAIRRESGVRPILEDSRNLYSLFSAVDPGAGALHVEALRMASRGLADGSVYLIADAESGEFSVERSSPLSVEPKAEVDLAVELGSDPLKAFAALVSNIPNQAFQSVPALSGILAASLGRELNLALDAHVIAMIAAASPAVVSGGGDMAGKLRTAINDLRAAGITGPFTAVISPEDSALFDLMTEVDSPRGFPFGLKIIDNPNVAPGEGYVLDASTAGTLFRGAAALDKDALSGFDTNESRVRMEWNGLFIVNEVSAIISLADGSS